MNFAFCLNNVMWSYGSFAAYIHTIHVLWNISKYFYSCRFALPFNFSASTRPLLSPSPPSLSLSLPGILWTLTLAIHSHPILWSHVQCFVRTIGQQMEKAQSINTLSPAHQ